MLLQWIRLCDADEAPAEGLVTEAVTETGQAICLARVGGELAAVDNLCPHRQGPLGQGWIEAGAVVCPWHSWAFDLKTGQGTYPEDARVRVFPVRVEAGEVQVGIGGEPE